MDLKISVNRNRVIHQVEENSECFGRKNKSCINDNINFTNGAYQHFHSKNFHFLCYYNQQIPAM